MANTLPPMNALKAYEAAARHQSFTKAAEELGVTQSAVSKQIQTLEDYLGMPLFIRMARTLVLTEPSERYYQQIAPALEAINQATVSVKENTEHLNINVMPSLSTHWLMPRIKAFNAKHPHVTIQVTTGEGEEIDFLKLRADIAIRGSTAPFKDVSSEFLMHEEMVLCCSPALLEASKPIQTLEDITQYPLLEYTPYPYMKEWTESVRLKTQKGKKNLEFQHFFMLIEAVNQGMGMALIPRFLITRELESKQVINPLDITYQTQFIYYILSPKHTAKRKTIRLFNQWIKKNI